MQDLLKEAARLYKMGFGVHWLRPKSKAPLKGGWTAPERGSFESLLHSYKEGMGLGVRLGQPSKLSSGEGGGFLAVVDVDLKSGRPEHQKEAFQLVMKLFPGLLEEAPTVKTGRGFHLYCRTERPLKSGKLGASSIETKVLSPTSPVNRRQRELLTALEIEKGYRMKTAWEVEFMSTGRQVVLPPTLHPDTGKPYIWDVPLSEGIPFPLVKGVREDLNPAAADSEKSEKQIGEGGFPVVNLIESSLSSRMVDLILSGEGSSGDRSADCFSAALAMTKAGFSEREVISVLTDRNHFLGEVAFEHRNTTNRERAADWVKEYCLKKAVHLVSAEKAFEEGVSVTPFLGETEEVLAQRKDLCESGDWQSKLSRGGQNGEGPPRPTLDNTLLVLRNAVGPAIVKRDIFRLREAYGMETPWGGKTGQLIGDDDAVRIRAWLASQYRFEPSKDTVFDALTEIALCNSYHPVREWLEGLPAWDGVNRLDHWLKNHFKGEGPDEYLAQVFRKWIVASVSRIYQPGKKFDWIIILEGLQGIGKSSFGSLLFGEGFFSDWLPALSDKDASLGLQGILCVEFGELAGLRKNELDIVKGFITRQVDKVRPPYGRKTLEVPRQCVFFGTTNRDQYLRDDTGNRRFMPVKVGTLNFKQLAEDREQLFAEALFIFQNELEPSFYLDGEAETYAAQIQSEKTVVTEAEVMAEIIDEARWDQESGKKDSLFAAFDFQKVQILKLFESSGPLAKYKGTVNDHHAAAQALRKLGYNRGKGRMRRIWVR